jgi:DNA (cytosine-5)-methyltransferase 1
MACAHDHRDAPATVRTIGNLSAYGEPVTLSAAAKHTAPITTIDLFAGAGGLTAGLHEGSSRFEPLVAVEADRVAAATYTANHIGTEVFAGKIEDWLQRGHIPQVDVIVGGPPCQGFSALGKQDVNDARNSLWESYAEVIVAASPKYFVVENVAQFLRSPQFAEFEARTAPGGMLSDYDISVRGVLNAVHYGAAQLRKRTVVIGRRRDQPVTALPVVTHQDPSTWATVKNAWTGLAWSVSDTKLPGRLTDDGIRGSFKTSELHLTRSYSDLSLRRFAEIPEGGNRFNLPDHLLSDCWRKHTTGSGDVMGRLSLDRPSVTIRTEFVKPEKGRYLHPTMNRAITLQEGARLQGFHDDYLWCGSKTDIARQIGNAVPVPLGAAIGRALSEVL